MTDILDLIPVCGTQNLPGVKVMVDIVSLADVDSIPDVVGGATPGDSLRITADIVLKPLKKFARLMIIAETGEVVDVQIGQNGSHSFGSTFDFKVKNTGADVTEWFEQRANGCFIALVHTINGPIRLLGHTELPVQQVAASGTTGMNGESERVWTVQWKSATGRPALYYEGAIDYDALT